MILHNVRYRGVVHWNQSEWKNYPDSGKRQRVIRPRSEWISRTDGSQRIVADELWQRCARRWQPGNGDARLKTGGKPKYLLSGLLRCDVCGAHYVMGDGRAYVCSSYVNGAACQNGIRVPRNHAQEVILGPIREGAVNDTRDAGAAATLLAVREEGRGGRGSGKAQAARYPEEPSLAQAGPWYRGLRRGSLSKQLHKRATLCVC